MQLWYFAYGSNLLRDQLTSRLGSSDYLGQPPRVANLAEHRLVFQTLTGGSPSFANLCRCGAGVTGVVYRFCPADFRALDRHESGYERRSLQVTDATGERLQAVAYVMRAESAAHHDRPEPEYLNRIIRGATEHGLSQAYIASIIAIAGGGNGLPEAI